MVYLFAGKFIYSVYIFRLVYQLEDTSTAKTHTHTHTKPKLLNRKKKSSYTKFWKIIIKYHTRTTKGRENIT